MYKHITLDERFLLAALIRADYELPDMAEAMGREASSLSREIERNSKPDGTYEPRHAHMLSKIRRSGSKRGCRKIETDKRLARRIESRPREKNANPALATDL
jgi:IS30 family transposase